MLGVRAVRASERKTTRKTRLTYKWKVSLNFGDQLPAFCFVWNFLFLSARCGPEIKNVRLEIFLLQTYQVDLHVGLEGLRLLHLQVVGGNHWKWASVNIYEGDPMHWQWHNWHWSLHCPRNFESAQSHLWAWLYAPLCLGGCTSPPVQTPPPRSPLAMLTTLHM